ncbi:MAG: putative Ig domain-containing protein [Methylomonas sp.]|jgi:prenyltransferase beta subunit
MRRLILSVLFLSSFATNAVRAAAIDNARLNGLAWLILNQSGDGSWRDSSGLEVAQTAAGVEALMNSGITKGNTFSTAVAWLQNYQAYSTDALSRQAIALFKAGRNTGGLMTQLINWRNDTTLSWGAYDHYSGSFPDTSLAMQAINITATSYSNAGYGIGFITGKQNSDGGWPYNPNDIGTPPSKIIPTALTLLALNQYNSVYAVQANITNGVTWLKNQQLSGGGFGEGATGTLLETALAYRALITIQGTSDTSVVNAQNYLIAQQQTNGGWGPNDPLATTLILAAMPATVLADTDNDGIPDALETSSLLGANIGGTGGDGAAAGKSLAISNGMSVAGVTKAATLASATLNVPYSATIAGSGSAPYSITTGRLPDGLSLNGTTGQISGTPTAVGAFDFVYQASASGSIVSVDSQIQVNAISSTQVPAMPDGYMLLLALILQVLGIVRAGNIAKSTNA